MPPTRLFSFIAFVVRLCRDQLMDRNPTAGGNESRTEWMANLLAYRALVIFPSAPRGAGLATTAWIKLEDAQEFFTWPLWEHPLDVGSIRLLLPLEELGSRNRIIRFYGSAASSQRFALGESELGIPPCIKSTSARLRESSLVPDKASWFRKIGKRQCDAQLPYRLLWHRRSQALAAGLQDDAGLGRSLGGKKPPRSRLGFGSVRPGDALNEQVRHCVAV